MRREDFEKVLNSEQAAAVTTGEGPVLVIAAAGTGKTRTLTHRVAWLVEQGVPAERVLLLTFTNRAAREMLERARAIVGESVGGLWGGTFHHLGNRLLRRHASLLGYHSDYSILDGDDTEKLVRHILSELELKGKGFPKASVLHGVFSLAANMSRPVEEVAAERFSEHAVNLDAILKVYTTYVERKQQLNCMDFDDLLTQSLRLFREHEPIRKRYREHFMHVLVDEYQDTNTVQSEWVDLLAEGRRNLFVVGDDFQSIYSWRGADFRNILSFPKRYPDAQVFRLETNYRSTPDILDIANACIAGNPEQFQKTLRAVRRPMAKPVQVRMDTGHDQARYVLEQMSVLCAQGYAPTDIAILYRAHYHAMELQLALNRARVAYDITSGVRFFEQAHIKDVCTVARLAGNPADELAFHRLLGFLPGVGEKTSARVWKKLAYRFEPWDPDQLILLRKSLPSKAHETWDDIARALGRCKRAEALESPHDLLSAFVDDFYGEFASNNFDNYRVRMEDVKGLVAFAANYKDLHEFLHEMALQSNLDEQPGQEEEEAAPRLPIRLSTVHQAKGLEWPVVFLLWLVDGLFPNYRALDECEGEAEERRLFYVATTRAKDHLFMCVPLYQRTYSGGMNGCRPSRFIDELPGKLTRAERVVC